MTAGLVAAMTTAVCFGLAPVCARRAVRLIGPLRANLGRIGVALVVMAVLAFALGRGVGDRYAAFAVAGAIGFGLGGMALFRALPALGAPLASMLVETIAAVAAGALAWLWLDDGLSPAQVGFAGLILVGVVLGLLPYVRSSAPRSRLRPGIGLAVLAACAQAVSAVISRQALLAIQGAQSTTGDTRSVSARLDVVSSAAFDRLTGGAAVTLVALALVGLLRTRARASGHLAEAVETGRQGGAGDAPAGLGPLATALPDRAWFWVGANALVGPVLGVTAMVWALQTLQPGLVQAVAAMAPLIAIPFARWLDGSRPPSRYYPGVVVAVVGLVGLALSGA